MIAYHLQRSYFHLVFSILLHLFAIVIIFLVPIGFGISYLLLVIVFYSGCREVNQALLSTSKSVKLLAKHVGQSWIIQSKATGIIGVTLLPQSIVTRYFLLLYFKPLCFGQKIICVPLFADSLSAEELRQIRVMMRLGNECLMHVAQ